MIRPIENLEDTQGIALDWVSYCQANEEAHKIYFNGKNGQDGSKNFANGGLAHSNSDHLNGSSRLGKAHNSANEFTLGL